MNKVTTSLLELLIAATNMSSRQPMKLKFYMQGHLDPTRRNINTKMGSTDPPPFQPQYKRFILLEEI